MRLTGAFILNILSTSAAQILATHPPALDAAPLSFAVRHAHATTGEAILFSDDVPASLQQHQAIIRTRPVTLYRPHSQEDFHKARRHAWQHNQSPALEWAQVTVMAPDMEHRETILELAKMTGDAYALPGQKNWYEVDGRWNTSIPFGWEDDGFRGNVFVSSDNSSVILSIKGTTLMGQGPTASRDKLNDNLLFSCCCARADVSWRWSTVCDCYSGGWRCDQTCLERSLVADNLFYSVGLNLYNDLAFLYPDANIWLVGHSLGGSIASLLGATFGVPVVAFESPGERLAASRLHLPTPPTSIPVPDYRMSPSESQWVMNTAVSRPEQPYFHPTIHVYHTADPIPQGICNGVRSLCAKGGYAMESRCHLGRTIIYDTVSKLGWRVDIGKHRISEVIYKILNEDWPDDDEGMDGEQPDGRRVRTVPEARPEEDCVDCFKWEFGDYK